MLVNDPVTSVTKWNKVVQPTVAGISVDMMHANAIRTATYDAALRPNTVASVAVVSLILEIHSASPLMVISAKLSAATTHTRAPDRTVFDSVLIGSPTLRHLAA